MALAVNQLKKVRATASPRQQDDGRLHNPLIYTPHADYPLSHSLAACLPIKDYKKAAKLERSPDTVDIVSPELCDDILNYLRPQLEQYKGCDIIDFHPGACLWSQKLHDFLQPRRHLLLEPNPHYFDPFIKPLLDQDASTYRHTTLSGAHPKTYWETYDHIFNDDLLPKRDAIPQGDPRLRKPTTNLLVTGNFARRYHDFRKQENGVHTANLLVNQMVQASQTNVLFHRYGLVRMLFWIPEDTRATVLPDSMLFKHSYSIGLESAAHLVEVAGHDRALLTRTETSKNKSQKKQRQEQLDAWGAQRVLARMKEKALTIPEHRRPLVHQTALEAGDSLEEYNPVRLPEGQTMAEMLSTHEAHIKRLEAYAKSLSPRAKNKTDTIPYRYKWTSTSDEYIKDVDKPHAGPWIDVWGAQFALELEFAASKAKLTKSKQTKFEARLIAASDQISSLLGKLTTNLTHKALMILMDEIFALCRPKPLLAWDRRPYEPLTVKDEEFWPRFSMHLLDITPRTETLGDDLMDADQANTMRRSLVKSLFTHASSSLEASIDRLGPGARELIVSEFRDPLVGGRLNLKDLTTKDISREQLNALTKAYIEWPFRPIGADAMDALEAGID